MKPLPVWMRAALALILMNVASGCGQADEKCDPWIAVALTEAQQQQWRVQQSIGARTTFAVKLLIAVDFGDTKPRPVDVALHRADAMDDKPIGDALQIVTVLPKDATSRRVVQSIALALAEKGSVQSDLRIAASLDDDSAHLPRVCMLSGSLLELK